MSKFSIPNTGLRRQFAIDHILHLLLFIIVFQVILSFIHQISKRTIIDQTMEIFKIESAERIAHQSAIALELIIEKSMNDPREVMRENIRSIDVTLNQIMLEKSSDFAGLLVNREGRLYLLMSGVEIFNFIFLSKLPQEPLDSSSRLYQYANEANISELKQGMIRSHIESNEVFHVFVPFLINGEYRAAYYLEMRPDISSITSEIKNSYSETGAIFTALILISILAMYYISSYSVQERNDALEVLYKEREKQLKEHIEIEKERLFTRRIYHAHHKAEKVMGFIKADLHQMNEYNMQENKSIISKYANFISRVIYDMKSYDPPMHTIRNPIFNSNINEILHFLTRNIFMRNSDDRRVYEFKYELDENLPPVHINEYIIWEIFEPIIQNAVEHNPSRQLVIRLKSEYLPSEKRIRVSIIDNGKGLDEILLQEDENGTAELFQENTSTKTGPDNRGYGCFIAHHLAVKKCGWKLNAENNDNEPGCRFVFDIPL